MTHLNVALFGTATAFLVVLILMAAHEKRLSCFKNSPNPIFCKVSHAR